MRFLFALSLVLGLLALIGWVLLSGSPSGDSRPRGTRGRRWIAAAVAFGMGGLSASYAGWQLGWATLGAIVAAGLAAWYAGTIGPPGGEDRH